MKKRIAVLLSLLLFASVFASCASVPDAAKVSDREQEELFPDGGQNGGENENGENTDKDDDPVTDKPESRYTKVIVLAGQSNAYGYTFANFLEQTIEPERYAKLTEGFTNARVFPDAELNDCVAESLEDFTVFSLLSYPVQTDTETAYYRFGPEIGMAETLAQAYPDEDIYIIKVAKGGTSLYEDWRSPSRTEGVSYLYHLLVSAIQSGLNVLAEAGLNPKIAGICWMQGEADAERRWSEADGFAYADKWSKAYGQNLEIFVNDLRNQFGAYALDGDTIDFIDAYINDGVNPLNDAVIWPYHETVNGAKTAFAQKDTHNHVLNTLAPNLMEEGKNGLRSDREFTAITPIDPLHYDSASMLKLGNMFGEQIIKICSGNS